MRPAHNEKNEVIALILTPLFISKGGKQTTLIFILKKKKKLAACVFFETGRVNVFHIQYVANVVGLFSGSDVNLILHIWAHVVWGGGCAPPFPPTSNKHKESWNRNLIPEGQYFDTKFPPPNIYVDRCLVLDTRI